MLNINLSSKKYAMNSLQNAHAILTDVQQAMQNIKQDENVAMNIGDNNLESSFLYYLSKYNQITSLNYWGNSASAKDIEFVARFNQLTSLNLYDNELKDVGLTALLKHMPQTIEHLNIGDNGLTDKSAKNFKNMSVNSVNLYANTSLTTKSIKHILQNDTITILNIGGIKHTPDIVPFIKNNQSITELDIVGSDIKNWDLTEFAQNTTIKTLICGFNNLDNDDVEKLSKMDNLQGIDLCGNALSDKGLCHLSKMQSLKYVKLGKTTPKGEKTTLTADSIDVLDSSKTIRQLHIVDMKVEDELAFALSRTKQINTLIIGNCNITSEQIALILTNPKLKSISFTNTPATDDLIKTIETALTKNKSIIHVGLSESNDFDQARALRRTAQVPVNKLYPTIAKLAESNKAQYLAVKSKER